MAEKLRWGIISTGKIAAQFAEGLKQVKDAELVAVGSRTQEAADEFGARFSIPHRYGSYQKLVNDPAVDIVYIGTPHSHHYDNSLMSLNAGKAVLCEKSFTVNAKQAKEVIALARKKKLFIMDAVWSRCLPAYDELRKLLAKGTLGDIRMVTVDFGFNFVFDPKDRLFDPALAGGALLDIGIYAVQMASLVYGGEPKTITTHAEFGKTGVDEQAGIVFNYDGGRMAVMTLSFQSETTQEANIMGRAGRVKVHRQFWHPDALTLTMQGKPDKLIKLPIKGNGYNYEAIEVMKCIRAGKTESALMPLDETLGIMRTMDAIRAKWGFKYPSEKKAERAKKRAQARS
jgi:predicted dehydrogenase